MNILLTGASGFIGKHILDGLLKAGHQVKTISHQQGGDYNQMRDKQSWLSHLNNIDIVINCVGIIVEKHNQTFSIIHFEAPIALFKACVEAGVKRVVQISALGADENAQMPYQMSKYKADNFLRSLPIEWIILRPSLVYGKTGKSMQMFQRLASLPVWPLMAGGNQLIQPVHVSDLTDTVVKCLTVSQSNITLNVVGAYPMTVKAWLQLMREKSGKTRAVIIPIPVNISLFFAELMKHIVPFIHPDNLHMLQRGNYADVKPLADFIGRRPLDIQTGWKRCCISH